MEKEVLALNKSKTHVCSPSSYECTHTTMPAYTPARTYNNTTLAYKQTLVQYAQETMYVVFYWSLPGMGVSGGSLCQM